MLPPHRYAQGELTAVFAEVVAGDAHSEQGARLHPLIARLHGNSGVSQRYLARPLEWYRTFAGFTDANAAFVETALDLGADAVTQALSQAGLTPRDVDLLVSATVTGLAVPSLDARIAARLEMRTDVKRVPLVGLGCVAGAAGIARVHDYLLGHPGEVAVLVATELCSLTLQRDDTSTANLVASGLFGDGAAAVVLIGPEHPAAQRDSAAQRDPEAEGDLGIERDPATTPQPQVLATRSRLYPETERAMGWDVGQSGLRIVLGVEVPDLVRTQVRADVDGFLEARGLTRADIGWWVAHPGGPKVLEALAEALAVEREALQVTWDSLDRIGNLSSASVLHVLADTLRERPPAAGSLGILLAMGPGFCLELVLLQAG